MAKMAKVSKALLLILVSLSALLIAVSSEGQTPTTPLTSSDELELSISSSTAPIPLCVEVKLTNISNHSITVNGQMAYTEPSLIVKTEGGEALKWHPPPPPPPLSAEDFIVLQPGKSVTKEMCDWTSHLSSPLSVGAYTIQARYVNTEEASNYSGMSTETWKGELISNIIQFSVDEE